MNNVKDIDRGLKRITDEIDRAYDSYTKVGVQEATQREDSTVDMVTVAAWNEFGNETTPERSFVRSATDDSRSKLNGMKASLYGKILDGKLTVERGLGILGLYLETQIKLKIKSNVQPPNAPSTIQKKTVGGKRGDHTLIDTGQLVQSIRYVVFMGGDKSEAI